MDDLDVTGENSPSTSTTQPNGHSGITLVLPSLRALQAANAGKKSKSKLATADLDQRPKIPRPVKLKPLKEVLTKLITQIKKKDDYAFFIHPVDPAQVPGYADAIKNPMDFGTMAAKVTKEKYRSLEEFTNDFRLVTTNAKTFNPPGSIYYIEADRLEAWGLEHIARASAHVIEYETDWNIDIEQDEDGSMLQQPMNIDDEVSTPRDLDGSRATSMTPAPGQAPMVGQGRRGPRGPYKKHAHSALSEGLDAEGRMPGVKDGVGVFPPGSDWAELMIALKIKGKRYKTKKERLRFEKEGPPYQADGSLDYAEMEDPFSVLNLLVPDPPSRPLVGSVYPSPSMTVPSPIAATDGSQPQLQFQSRIYTPMLITVPSDRPLPVLSTLSNTLTQSPAIPTPSTLPPKKRRHWTIVRSAPTRSRGKDKDSDATTDETKATSKVLRDAGPADYGTFATLFGELAAPSGTGTADYMYGSEHRVFATLRSTIEHRGSVLQRDDTESAADEEQEAPLTDERAEEAWDYLRDVVYGGVDGYAYVRSLAEFVTPSVYLDRIAKEKGDADVDEKPVLENCDAALRLDVPLARYVEDNLVDMVTRGRHGWLRDVFFPVAPCDMSPFHMRLAALPDAIRDVAPVEEWRQGPLDMAALIRVPEELTTEGILEGGPGEDSEHADIERALGWSVGMLEELGKQVRMKVKEEVSDDAVELAANAMDVDVKSDDGSTPTLPEQEDPLVKRVRLNLLALAKRAPLDKLAKVPVKLVPEHIRGIVPTA